jgi:hypothetical protein
MKTFSLKLSEKSLKMWFLEFNDFDDCWRLPYAFIFLDLDTLCLLKIHLMNVLLTFNRLVAAIG